LVFDFDTLQVLVNLIDGSTALTSKLDSFGGRDKCCILLSWSKVNEVIIINWSYGEVFAGIRCEMGILSWGWWWRRGAGKDVVGFMIVMNGIWRVGSVLDINGRAVLRNIVAGCAAVTAGENWADGEDLLDLFFGSSAIVAVMFLLVHCFREGHRNKNLHMTGEDKVKLLILISWLCFPEKSWSPFNAICLSHLGLQSLLVLNLRLLGGSSFVITGDEGVNNWLPEPDRFPLFLFSNWSNGRRCRLCSCRIEQKALFASLYDPLATVHPFLISVLRTLTFLMYIASFHFPDSS
jgi:hypothetical protein